MWVSGGVGWCLVGGQGGRWCGEPCVEACVITLIIYIFLLISGVNLYLGSCFSNRSYFLVSFNKFPKSGYIPVLGWCFIIFSLI